MKKSVIISFVFLLLLNVGMADLLGQGVGINPSGNSPDPSAGLDIDFSDKGVLISRMTTTQRNAISNPAEGLVIFNTDCKTFNYNAGTSSVPNWVA
ncbi:MAG: hypothetical protein IT223_12685, partial [Crocinitomicaceae bacterium]|nr:hypothetical protein [Crocinitomicaceae bacterium]